MARLHPAPPGGPDAERHLPVQRAGAMAVAVDGQRDAGRHGAAGELAVEIQV